MVVPKAKAFITLQGAGSFDTILDWNDTASNLDLDGNMLTTYRSATVIIDGHRFVARNLTFKVKWIDRVDLINISSSIGSHICGSAVPIISFLICPLYAYVSVVFLVFESPMKP